MSDDAKCCGRISAWADGPLQLGCVVCPDSPTWWRRAENREDGQPYQLATLEEAYPDAERPSRQR